MVKYKGETHAWLLTSSGIQRANYCGPGTNLEKRLADGDKPVSKMDSICMQHDIAYAEAKTSEDVRAADKSMIKKMDADMTIPSFEKKVIGTMMRAKMAGENITGKTFFAKVEKKRKLTRKRTFTAPTAPIARKRRNIAAALRNPPRFL